MRPDILDRIFAEASDRAFQDESCRASVARVESGLLVNLRPIRILAPPWVLALSFILLFAVLGTASASVLGMHGLHVLSGWQRGLIFLTLTVVVWLSSVACAREMRPTGPRFGMLSLLVAASAFPALFSLIFDNYSIQKFVPEGIPCLVAGLCASMPTAIVAVYLLRRGFVMDWSQAGLAAGTLSGLTGLAMLELHCPNLKAIHVITWHVAVVIVSGILGFAAGRVADHFRRL
jgi:hypothetical protein